jgi:drug/metabolite transporter (DMT)-like permease
MGAVIAVCLGLMAATLFGAASVLEERSTKQVTQRAALSPRLLADLVRRPLFLAAIGVNVAGCALQIAALHLGSLTLIQPLLVLSLLFAVVIAAVARRQRPDGVLLAGVACCAVGIGGFLAVARPHGGTGTAGSAAALPLVAGLAAVLAGCLAAARWGPAPLRPLWLALGCGADFGVNALLLKIVPATLPAGFADPLRQWPLYLMVIVTPVGFLLNQNAFQAGTLIAPALAVITTADPLVSMAAGAAFLHEKIAAAPPELAIEGLALAVTITGIIALAQRVPRVAQMLDSPGPAVTGRGPVSAGPGTAAVGHLIGARIPHLAVVPVLPGFGPVSGSSTEGGFVTGHRVLPSGRQHAQAGGTALKLLGLADVHGNRCEAQVLDKPDRAKRAPGDQQPVVPERYDQAAALFGDRTHRQEQSGPCQPWPQHEDPAGQRGRRRLKTHHVSIWDRDHRAA